MSDDKKQDLTFEAGEVIVCTTGEYSQFGIEFFAVATKPFNMVEQAQKHAAEKRRAGNPWNVDMEGFAAFLITHELVMPVNYRVVHPGNHGEFAPDFNVPPKE